LQPVAATLARGAARERSDAMRVRSMRVAGELIEVSE
jgi:hypothetical protein